MMYAIVGHEHGGPEVIEHGDRRLTLGAEVDYKERLGGLLRCYRPAAWRWDKTGDPALPAGGLLASSHVLAISLAANLLWVAVKRSKIMPSRLVPKPPPLAVDSLLFLRHWAIGLRLAGKYTPWLHNHHVGRVSRPVYSRANWPFHGCC